MWFGEIYSVDSSRKDYFQALKGAFNPSLLARTALCNILEVKYSLSYSPYEIEIFNHTSLKLHNEILVSMSHTEDVAIAFTISQLDHPEVISIGVDIEKCDRVIPDYLIDRYQREEDEVFSPVCAWLLKEAAFKAIQPLFHGCRDLKDIVIKEDTFFLAGRPEIRGFSSLKVENDYFIAFAYVES